MRMLARRLSLYLVTAWVAITVNFLLPRMMPGNPVQQMVGKITGQISRNRSTPLNWPLG